MSRTTPLLVRILRSPDRVSALSPGDWDLLVRQARRAGLLGRLHALLEERGLGDAVPGRPAAHLRAARIEADRVNRAACWEAGQIALVGERVGVPVLVLKGGAYALAGLRAARGRLYADLDVLVPRAALDLFEMALRADGWGATHLDAYDQRYYRRWMHEIPPLRHVRRQTNLDVHHGLLPDTVARRPDPRLLLEASRPVPGVEGLYVPAPEDLWLHSAIHLFQEGEFGHALRDLSDLDRLAREFAEQEPEFWRRLERRMVALKAERQASHALRLLDRVLGTPIPAGLLRTARAHAPAAPIDALVHWLFGRVFRPPHQSARVPGQGLAEWLLYVRSHALRMPPHLLLPHLAYKALVAPVREWREAHRERRRRIRALNAENRRA